MICNAHLISRYVHSECDASIERDKKGVGYVCPICQNEVSVVRKPLIRGGDYVNLHNNNPSYPSLASVVIIVNELIL